jgi:hypothetical protein
LCKHVHMCVCVCVCVCVWRGGSDTDNFVDKPIVITISWPGLLKESLLPGWAVKWIYLKQKRETGKIVLYRLLIHETWNHKQNSIVAHMQ